MACVSAGMLMVFLQILDLHEPRAWRLFIDSSIRSLKGVLLHNGNHSPYISEAHSMHLKDDYNYVKLLLEKINYNKYQWDVSMG